MQQEFPKYYKANGKLLLTSEYFVLDGAKALAIPTKFNQQLEVYPSNKEGIIWESFDEKNNLWFSCTFSKNSQLLSYSDNDVAITLEKILLLAKELSAQIEFNQLHIKTKINFNRHFGLGTSSTLISLIAQWLKVDPYFLLEHSFGGSGYDIACATAKTAIIYQTKNNDRTIEAIEFNPPFKENIYFIYLEKKQNSREGINFYKKLDLIEKEKTIEKLNQITNDLLLCNNIYDFNYLIKQHEELVANQLVLEPIKNQLFSDFDGSVKSLGAWGGDFIMVSSANGAEYIKKYFSEKKYNNIISFIEMF